ncbi:MAG: NUDIX domain-containing protein [Endomicrobiales bacterium]|nr:NUDIX domain-containing protein [Endomicrobiales bacterium]
MIKQVYKFCPLCRYYLSKVRIDGHVRLVCQKCGWVYYKNPLPVTSCVAVNKKGEMLIAKRNLDPGKGSWALPGGFIELNETPEDSCLRELKEEVGIDGKIMRLVGVYVQNTEEYGSLLVVGYMVKAMHDNLSINSEVQEAKFVKKNSMPYIPFMAHRKLIKEVFGK